MATNTASAPKAPSVAKAMVGGGVSASGSRPKAAGKALRRLLLERATNGDFLLEQQYAMGGGEYHEPETHVFAADDFEGLIAHVRKMLGISGGKAAEKAGEKVAHAA